MYPFFRKLAGSGVHCWNFPELPPTHVSIDSRGWPFGQVSLKMEDAIGDHIGVHAPISIQHAWPVGSARYTARGRAYSAEKRSRDGQPQAQSQEYQPVIDDISVQLFLW